MGDVPAGDEPVVDKDEQLEKIEASLVPGERVRAVFDLKGGGTGFVGVTTKRLVVYDRAFMRRMKAVVSIPYSRIISVAAEDESGLLSGRGFFAESTLVVSTSNENVELEFRSADKAHLAHQLILEHIL